MSLEEDLAAARKLGISYAAYKARQYEASIRETGKPPEIARKQREDDAAGHKFPKRACQCCGKEFWPKRSGQKYCDYECAYQGKRKRDTSYRRKKADAERTAVRRDNHRPKAKRNENPQTIGHLIRNYRLDMQLTAGELGGKCGRSQSGILSYETGKTEPGWDTLCRMAEVLGAAFRRDMLRMLEEDET